MTAIDPRESRLPNWARDLIRSLRSDIESLETALRIACEQRAPGATGLVLAHPYSDKPVALNDRAMVQFTVEGGGKINVMLRDGALDVTESGGLSFLSIRPQAANSCTIKVTTR